MPRDPWARAHERTLTLDGAPRRLQFARLSTGEKANLELLLAMFRMQNDRIQRIASEPIAQQLAEIAQEREANLRFGQWVEEAVSAHVRPAEPWTTADGVEVRDGASYVDAYGNDELIAAVMVLYDAQSVSAALAKNSESPRDSSPGSVAPSPAPRGDAPAPTAAPVAPSDSARPAAAAVLPETPPSGSMTVAAESSPTSVPSAA